MKAERAEHAQAPLFYMLLYYSGTVITLIGTQHNSNWTWQSIDVRKLNIQICAFSPPLEGAGGLGKGLGQSRLHLQS